MIRPNVVVITSHDTGRYFGYSGAQTAVTPRIDALAADGVSLAKHHCVSPVCSPSRATMLTGHHPQTHGLMFLTHSPFWWKMRDPSTHLASRLKREGWTSALFGWQHESESSEELGYDSVHAQGPPPAGEVVGAFREWLLRERRVSEPFFAQIGTFETHTPYDFGGATPTDPDRVWLPPHVADTPATREHFAGLEGSLAVLDSAVGTVLDALEQAGIADDTIIVFASDHGVEAGRAKWTSYDPGLEIATLIRWPGGGVSGGRAVDAVTSNVDITPTLYDLLGLEPDPTFEGQSLAGLLRGEEPTAEQRGRAVFALYQTSERSHRVARTDRFKLIWNVVPGRTFVTPSDMANPDAKTRVPLPKLELYDLANDPGELENVAESPDYAATVCDLVGRLTAWMHETRDPVLDGPVMTPYEAQSRDALRDAAGSR